MSIARRRPIRSSCVKWSDTVPGSPDIGFACQAIRSFLASPSATLLRPFHPFPWFSERSGSAVSTPAHPAPEGGIAAPENRLGAKVTEGPTLDAVRRTESLWLSRLRWRMRGAWLWPAFFGLTLLDGIVIWRLPPYDGRAARPGRRDPARRLREPAAGGARRAARRAPAPARPAGPAARDRHGLRRDGAARRCSPSLVLAAGLVHQPSIAARAGGAEAAAVGAVRDRVRLAEPAVRGGTRGRGRPASSSPSPTACACPAPIRSAGCATSSTSTPTPRGSCATTRWSPTRRLRTVGGFH